MGSIVPMLALVVAGCGGSSRPAATRVPRVEQAVKSTLERSLMTSQPRTEQGSRPATHVRRVRCTKTSGSRFSCQVIFEDGTSRRLRVHERSDGDVVLG
jgi:hypothetical protein